MSTYVPPALRGIGGKVSIRAVDRVWRVQLRYSKDGPFEIDSFLNKITSELSAECKPISATESPVHAQQEANEDDVEVSIIDLASDLRTDELRELLELFKKTSSVASDEFPDGDPKATLTFPASLSKESRALLHQDAQDFGLFSKSQGIGEARKLLIGSEAFKACDEGQAAEASGAPDTSTSSKASKDMRSRANYLWRLCLMEAGSSLAAYSQGEILEILLEQQRVLKADKAAKKAATGEAKAKKPEKAPAGDAVSSSSISTSSSSEGEGSPKEAAAAETKAALPAPADTASASSDEDAEEAKPVPVGVSASGEEPVTGGANTAATAPVADPETTSSKSKSKGKAAQRLPQRFVFSSVGMPKDIADLIERREAGSRLAEAIRAGDEPTALKTIEDHPMAAWVRYESEEQQPYPLHMAALVGLSSVVEALAKLPGVIDQRDVNYATPLKVAKKSGKTDIVDLLLRLGAKDFEVAMSHTTTPVAIAGGPPEHAYGTPGRKSVSSSPVPVVGSRSKHSPSFSKSGGVGSWSASRRMSGGGVNSVGGGNSPSSHDVASSYGTSPSLARSFSGTSPKVGTPSMNVKGVGSQGKKIPKSGGGAPHAAVVVGSSGGKPPRPPSSLSRSPGNIFAILLEEEELTGSGGISEALKGLSLKKGGNRRGSQSGGVASSFAENGGETGAPKDGSGGISIGVQQQGFTIAATALNSNGKESTSAPASAADPSTTRKGAKSKGGLAQALKGAPTQSPADSKPSAGAKGSEGLDAASGPGRGTSDAGGGSHGGANKHAQSSGGAAAVPVPDSEKKARWKSRHTESPAGSYEAPSVGSHASKMGFKSSGKADETSSWRFGSQGAGIGHSPSSLSGSPSVSGPGKKSGRNSKGGPGAAASPGTSFTSSGFGVPTVHPISSSIGRDHSNASGPPAPGSQPGAIIHGFGRGRGRAQPAPAVTCVPVPQVLNINQ